MLSFCSTAALSAVTPFSASLLIAWWFFIPRLQMLLLLPKCNTLHMALENLMQLFISSCGRSG